MWEFLISVDNIGFSVLVGCTITGTLTLGLCLVEHWWSYVNDGKPETPLWTFMLTSAGAGIVIISVCVVINILHLLYHAIPWELSLSVLTFLIVTWVARYLRRTHKVIHKHVTTPDAHTLNNINKLRESEEYTKLEEYRR
jgi:hypothetical protein